MGVGNAPVVRLLELRGRQTVFNVDGADWQRKKWGGFARRYLRMCEGLAARGRSILIADAHAVQRYYRELFDRATEYVPYGADPPRDGGLEALRKFGLQPGGYGLFVGRLVPENAPHDLLAGVIEARLPLTTVIVGDATYAGDYIARLKDEAPSGTVFTGFQFGTAYQQLSTHARLFVLAATVGGTHPVLVEQMAAGNCILARETESNHEVLGDAGLYWRTPAELAALLRSIWDDDSRRQTLGDAARDRARELYDWDRVTERYLDLCRRTLAATRRASVPQG
jgi:glycosyltransferase involved in cell wall biosynthesis